MGERVKKRDVPEVLRKLLNADVHLTKIFIRYMERCMPFEQVKVHYKMLEVSCHGVFWIASWLAFVWVLNSSNLYQMQVNFIIGLLLDIVLVAVIKAITRRRRPAVNDDPLAMGPDKFSFPSGHASRSMFVVYFFFNLWPVSWIFRLPMLAWLVSVCASRILLFRHYLLDILAGVCLGILEGLFIGLIYLDQETCVSLISWISDEKVEGGEYHV
ncbi:polyisoprenoid diphosphate/phosphate phosphohydrolase PLPP6 [Athalia rosae]|uniref:polyisoprenoid diphosphate/phosphate phosphohydrolase PLPP6 n=1 Tax=Athalia rosae TaxID=37344 RepID=UPI000626758F|nr:polyisoprenoid diphosphate/phosphate phosphohydrolase PLPP6 [Athalia rosae]